MDDLELTRLCWLAMTGLDPLYSEGATRYEHDGKPYDPLHDDAQAFGLICKMIDMNDNERWEISNHVIFYQHRDFNYTQLGRFFNADHMRRAICECVAKLQAAK